MSTCCMHANFGQNPVIRSGYIVHILMIPANISADIDADTDADGIRITVCASHSYLFRGVYALSYIQFYTCSTNSRKEDTKHIIFENTRLLFTQFRP